MTESMIFGVDVVILFVFVFAVLICLLTLCGFIGCVVYKWSNGGNKYKKLRHVDTNL